MTTSEIHAPQSVYEVRIISGITPDEVEPILNMAAESGRFSSDVMMTAEDMAWDSAYGDGSEPHTFLKATVNHSGRDRVVGFVCYGAIPLWPGNYELYGIAVEPVCRRLGIGTALLAAVRGQISGVQGHHLYLETGEDQLFESARLFYEANGFSAQHRYIKQFVPTEGGVVYRCEIGPDMTEDQYQ